MRERFREILRIITETLESLNPETHIPPDDTPNPKP